MPEQSLPANSVSTVRVIAFSKNYQSLSHRLLVPSRLREGRAARPGRALSSFPGSRLETHCSARLPPHVLPMLLIGWKLIPHPPPENHTPWQLNRIAAKICWLRPPPLNAACSWNSPARLTGHAPRGIRGCCSTGVENGSTRQVGSCSWGGDGGAVGRSTSTNNR